jgi:hypothetical protein
VRAGGTIRFACGRRPVTIRMHATAKVLNTRRRVVLDGGGKVTLGGEGRRRILYMNTCDRALVWATAHCEDQATPRLVVRGMRLRGGDATGEVVDGGGALSSIGVSWDVRASRFTGNRAVGAGANPARPGTPGGGSGGAIYNDGNRFCLQITGSRMIGNRAAEGGGAVFFVSNDRTGTMAITGSVLERNPSAGFETRGVPGIFFLGAGRPAITRSVLRRLTARRRAPRRGPPPPPGAAPGPARGTRAAARRTDPPPRSGAR